MSYINYDQLDDLYRESLNDIEDLQEKLADTLRNWQEDVSRLEIKLQELRSEDDQLKQKQQLIREN